MCFKAHNKGCENLKRLATVTALPVASPTGNGAAVGNIPAVVGKVTSVRYDVSKNIGAERISARNTILKAVIFDFGNVICGFEYDLFLERLRRWSALPVETLREKIFGSGAHRRFERGDIDTTAFHRFVESATGAKIPEEAFAEAFIDIFTPLEEVCSIIRELKGKTRLGLLSNTNELHFARCIRPIPVFPLFDSITLSYEVGALKPEEAIYHDALKKLSFSSCECVFIDDIPAYVEGAKAIGMQGIRFETPEQLRADLAKLNVFSL